MPTNQTMVVLPAARLGVDPVSALDGRVLRFSTASDDDYKNGDNWVEQTVWLEVQCWNALAERARTLNLHKGDVVAVIGRLKQATYEKDGITRTVTRIWADRLNLVQRKGTSKPAAQNSPSASDARKAEDFPPMDDSANNAGSDDVPF